jgi:hypothetical protein
MSTRPSYTARLPFKDVAGHQIHLEVWLPTSEQRKGSSGRVPVVVWLHGGGVYSFLLPLQLPPRLPASKNPPHLDFGEATCSTERR